MHALLRHATHEGDGIRHPLVGVGKISRQVYTRNAEGKAVRTEYDPMGRVAATWTTNETESVGLQRRTYGYDWLGRRVRTTDERGNDTTVAYSADGLVTTTTYPTGLTSVRTTEVFGRTVSTTGTASAESISREAASTTSRVSTNATR